MCIPIGIEDYICFLFVFTKDGKRYFIVVKIIAPRLVLYNVSVVQ